MAASLLWKLHPTAGRLRFLSNRGGGLDPIGEGVMSTKGRKDANSIEKS